MTTAPYVRPYFDSGIFISWLKDTDIGPLADGAIGDRHPVSEHVLSEAEHGQYPVVTSFFTMAEVYKKVGHGVQSLTDAENGKIMDYFENEWIAWVEVDRNVGADANRLLVEYKTQKLRPVDAIHLASALRAKCDVLLTWDGPLAKIQHSSIRIEFPRMNPGTLFENQE